MDFDFEGGEPGASEKRQCAALRRNGFVLLDGRPCKIVEMTTSKAGKMDLQR